MLRLAKYLLTLGVLIGAVLYAHLGYLYVVEGHGLHPAACALAIVALSVLFSVGLRLTRRARI